MADQDLLQLGLMLVEAVQAVQAAVEQIMVIVRHMVDILLKVGDLAHKATLVDQAEQVQADLHFQIKVMAVEVVAVVVPDHRATMERLGQIRRLTQHGLV